MYKFWRVLLVLTAVGTLPIEAAEIERIELFQRPDVMTAQQRIVGNLRAVAKTDGVVVKVPQLYLFYSDYSAAYHLGGLRSGFERELSITVNSQRRERSMVRLDRLLERTITPTDEAFGLDDLPEADLYVALYRRENCEECTQVRQALVDWLEQRPEQLVVWLDVRTDAPRD